MRILAETEGKHKDRNFFLPGSMRLAIFVPTGWYRSMADRRRGEHVMAVEVRSAKGAATRDQILDVAGKLIQLRGYHATSLDDVLKSGVGKGTSTTTSRARISAARSSSGCSGLRQRTPICSPIPLPTLSTRSRRSWTAYSTTSASAAASAAAPWESGLELSDVHEVPPAASRHVPPVAGDAGRVLARPGERAPRSGLDPASAAEFLVAATRGAILLTKVARDISVVGGA